MENNHQEPSETEIAAALGIDLQEVHRLLQTSTDPISLQLSLDDHGVQFGETLQDPKASNPMEDARLDERTAAIVESMRALTPAERIVINLRFGLGLKELPRRAGDPRARFVVCEEARGIEYTLEEVGEKIGRTRERVRQLEADALEKLRNAEHPACFRLALQNEGDGQAPRKLAPFFSANGDVRMQWTWEDIGLPLRQANALKRQGMYTVGDYIHLKEKGLLTIPNMNTKGFQVVDDAIAAAFEDYGLHQTQRGQVE